MWAILLSVHYRGGRDTECESIDPQIGVVTRATTSTRISDEKGVLICGAAVRRSYRAFARQAWNRGTASSFSLSLCREDFRPVFRLGGYGEKGFIIFFFFFLGRIEWLINEEERFYDGYVCVLKRIIFLTLCTPDLFRRNHQLQTIRTRGFDEIYDYLCI